MWAWITSKSLARFAIASISIAKAAL